MNLQKYLKQALRDFGLSDGEAKLYLTILKYPQIEAAQLKEKTPYSMAGIYKMLHALSDKGFVNPSQDNSPIKFTATPLDKTANKFATQGRKLQRISAKLSELSRLSEIPTETEIFDENDLTDFYLNIPSKINDFIWCVGSFEAVMKFFGPTIEKEFIGGRIKKGITADAIIFDNSKFSEELAGRDIKEKRETRIISHQNYPLEFDYLFGDTILNFYKDPEDKIKILKTESPDIAKAKLIQYQAIWNSTQE